ncbi:unnamed protein product [Lymnaea stagnalis]|uniref:Small vasohibin-binding protein n=1 Tax=Lymnaea stagnalis TaxID=6523 RepID=A0AAV2IA48_LYMST
MKMPTLIKKKDSISIDLTSNNCHSPIANEHNKTETRLDLFFQMKDLPVAHRIEALKLLTQELQNDIIVSTLPPNCGDHNYKVKAATTNQKTLFPEDVLGNLRSCRESNRSAEMLEELLSKGSSLSNESEDQEENILPKPKKGPIKSKKDFNTSKITLKKPKSFDGIYLFKNEKDQSANTKLSRKVNKQIRPCSLHMDDNNLDALAICKSINLQEKSKQKMYTNSQKARVHPTQVKSSSSKLSAARISLNNAAMEYSKRSSSFSGQAQRRKSVPVGKEDIKTTKVFLSEKQSGVIFDCGMPIPCAPPATPTPEVLKKTEYVPSLQDIRAQRMVREKLQTIEDQAMTTEKKKIEQSLKIDRKSMQEKRMELKRIQRLQIYALNKVMTDLEYKNFVMFMRSVE